jgi:hypothetical protein
MQRYSILNNLNKCYFCNRPAQNTHEVFFGRNRLTSIQNGFCVGLCMWHHNLGGNQSVHGNREMDLILKRLYQQEYEKNHSREDFINLIGKSYL